MLLRQPTRVCTVQTEQPQAINLSLYHLRAFSSHTITIVFLLHGFFPVVSRSQSAFLCVCLVHLVALRPSAMDTMWVGSLKGEEEG